MKLTDRKYTTSTEKGQTNCYHSPFNIAQFTVYMAFYCITIIASCLTHRNDEPLYKSIGRWSAQEIERKISDCLQASVAAATAVQDSSLDSPLYGAKASLLAKRSAPHTGKSRREWIETSFLKNLVSARCFVGITAVTVNLLRLKYMYKVPSR